MLNSFIAMTVTLSVPLCSPCNERGCHSVMVCHGVFAHTYARGCERMRVFPTFYLYACSYVCKITMTQCDSMTIPANTRVVAVMVLCHGKITVTIAKLNNKSFPEVSNEVNC